MKIFTLIPKVMAEVGAIGKSGYNQHDKYRFRSIDDVYNALQPALHKNGVFFVPNVLESKEEHIQSNSGKDMLRIKLKVRYDVYADDGSNFQTVVEGEAIDRGDKATNKALTAAFKYMLIQVFCIAVEGQEDADNESHEINNTPVKNETIKREEPKTIPSTTQKPASDFGEEVFPYPKFKGKKIKEINKDALLSYIDYFRNSEKPPRGMAEFIQSVDKYFNEDTIPF